MRDFSWSNRTQNVPDFHLTDESKSVIKNILDSKCAENDGVIDIDELGDCLEAFGLEADDEDIDFLKKHFDDNGDGELEVKELMDNIDVLNWHCFYGKDLMREFRSIDTDGDRYIRYPEMLRVLTTRGPAPLGAKEGRQLLDKLARKFDENFDGKFSYSEFVKIYMSDLLPYKEVLEQGLAPGDIKDGANGEEKAPASPDTEKAKKKKSVVKKKQSTLTEDKANGHHGAHGGATRGDTRYGTSPPGGAHAAARSETRPKTGARSVSDGKMAPKSARPKTHRTVSSTSTTSSTGKWDVTRSTAASKSRQNLFRPI